MSENETGNEPRTEEAEEEREPAHANILRWTSRILVYTGAAVMIVLGGLFLLWRFVLTDVFASRFGWTEGFPWELKLAAVGGLILYNLGRLPAYLRYFFPPAEDGKAEKFHRRER